MKKIWLAEFIGTFFLVFLGCGSLIAAETGYLKESYAAFVFGGTVLAMIAAFGHISYAHFNPAVSVGFFVLRRISFKGLLLYWSAEFSGATFASFLHMLIFGNTHSFGMTRPSMSFAPSFLLEAIGTFMLMSVITVVATDERVHKALPALAVGTTVTVISIVFGPMSGGSFNPARTMGPGIFSGVFTHMPMYFSASILGGAAGAFITRMIIGNREIPSAVTR